MQVNFKDASLVAGLAIFHGKDSTIVHYSHTVITIIDYHFLHTEEQNDDVWKYGEGGGWWLGAGG